MASRRGKSGSSDRFLFTWAPKSLQTVIAAMKRHLLLERKAMTNLDNIAKSRDITLPTKVHIVKVVVFPVVMYEYERWTIKKAEHPLSEKYKSNYNELSPHSCQNGHHQKVYKQ